ncbi:ATP-binding protein [Methylobacterium sp. 1973]|uniref:ATP-binding protein n=1 Tax=Methylobacterium sp. 1973 TaxID=3156421 RepID=UPI0033950D46
MSFEYTNLWQDAFQDRKKDRYLEVREKLRSSYRSFWNNAAVLSRQIAVDLPNLTLHDEAHFEALWRSADLIAGLNYGLNPAETYVLGGAILVHDIGHAVAAFPGRMSEIESTELWKDAILAEYTRDPSAHLPSPAELENPPERVRKAALFSTLRALHAEKATELASLRFDNPKTGTTVHLIEDDQLRIHLGEVIGEVAASHHWNLTTLLDRFVGIRGAPPGMPGEWSIDPIKLACLLRCADAVQIDQARAPDFLYAMLQLNGLSEAHWRAQNRLAAPTPDTDDPSALVFTSTKAFSEGDAEAWWIAHDAVVVANNELQSCASLMRDLKKKQFSITRVKDASAPERLASHIRPVGWRPINAVVKVGPTERVVGMLGGSQLYGDDPVVPLRELIQNAADAVRARRALEPASSHYEGHIVVRLVAGAQEGRAIYSLNVDDDGIGMSEKVLTGPFLEFGTSYWTSDHIRSEHPGLSRRVLRQTGRYGIGFFSVLMISSKIHVSSRPFNAAASDLRTLVFNEGIKHRPLLLQGSKDVLPSYISTRVSLVVSEEDVSSMLTMQKRFSNDTVEIRLEQLVAHLCATLDCDVFVETGDSQRTQVHDRFWHQGDPLTWLRAVELADARQEDRLDDYLAEASSRLTKFVVEGHVEGWAAVGTRPIETGIATVGGFVVGQSGRNPGSFSSLYIGALPYSPEGPRRHGGQLREITPTLSDWATDSARIFKGMELDGSQNHFAVIAICQFGGDSSLIATAKMSRKFIEISKIVDLIEADQEILISVDQRGLRDAKLEAGNIVFRIRPGVGMALENNEIEFTSNIIESVGFYGVHQPLYYSIIMGKNEPYGSLISILEKTCQERNIMIEKAVLEEADVAVYRGEDSPRQKLTNGMSIKCSVFSIKKATIAS